MISISTDIYWMLTAYIAAVAVWVRYSRYFRAKPAFQKLPNSNGYLPVSIIIPVRDEARTIARVIESLLLLDYPALQIIIVDDGSIDGTRQIAELYPVKVVSAPPRPSDWIGKSWACYIGAKKATGSYLLFTDADTVHKPDSLKRAVSFLVHRRAKLISAPSYHSNLLWWEKLLGPFYCMIHAGACPFDPVSVKNPYALGQYLLFEKEFYHYIGGHGAVRSEVADDAAIARRVMMLKGKYAVYPGPPLCEVQMYRSFREFVRGWSRILRLGMNELRPETVFHTFLPLLALNVSNLISLKPASWIPVVATLICFYLVQKKIGNFSIAGVLMFPVPVILFLALSCQAMIAHWLNLPVLWRGRRYLIPKKMVLKT